LRVFNTWINAVQNQPSQPLNRRNILQLIGTSPLFLTVGSLFALPSKAAEAKPYATAVKFNASSNPSTVAQRASIFTDATIDITYSDRTVKTAQALSFVELFRTGDTLTQPPAAGNGKIIAAGYTRPDGVTPILDTDGKQMFSDCVDGQSLIKLANPSVPGVDGNTLFLVTQYEYKSVNVAGAAIYGTLPCPMTITTLEQNTQTGALSVKYQYQVPTISVHGLWITCGGSLSPWNTHLSSEEYEPDAWLVMLRKTKGSALTSSELTTWKASQVTKANASLSRFFEFSRNTLDTASTPEANTTANPYHYGHLPEVTVHPDGTGSIQKHYCLGRISRELVEVMPDNKTVLMGDDYTGGALFMFIANTAGDLSAGTLYGAKMTQTSADSGGTFTLRWVKLGSASSKEIKALADSLSPKDILDVRFTDPSDSAYTKLALDGWGYQWVKVQPAQAKAAAFLETHRYAAIAGVTMELTKLEGVAVNAKDKLAYFAMSRIETTMLAGPEQAATTRPDVDDIQLAALRPGAVYAARLNGGQSDSDGQAISSAWVPTDFYVPKGLLGENMATDADGNNANILKISQPDNVKFSETMRTLFVGEDGSGHLNNYVWAYNVDTQQLSKLLSTPAGAECTGLQAVDNINGFAYLMSGFQHAGDLSYNATTGTGSLNGKTVPADLMSAISSNWGGIKQKSAVGYVKGLPVVRT
jgi:secreted PhoX family phosphatase